ncbi:ribose-5-phosphate isomerase [bacterium]|nr:ribose-5-phosphate isomerase [bacterium]
MKIAVINEVSARDKNPYILSAIKKCGIEVVNVGMTEKDTAENGLTYIHTGLMAGILLNLGAVDFAVGGCGTGQGFLLSAMQYPEVFCGLIDNPLDAWLFSQINGGNCISLALNKGFGWAGDKNLENIFEKLFEDEFGRGYPKERSESQRLSRMTLKNISISVHKPMEEILNNMDKSILNTVFAHAPFVELIKGSCKNTALQNNILNNYYRGSI